ncbi:MAG TPA: ABC transporter permease [Thermohalobaculum sp.]|nr:ABC transporter permease [Thermohalobaculum sp.]
MTRERPAPRTAGGQARGILAPARVLFALIMREMTTRFGRSMMGYVWAFIEPVAFIALLSLAFSRISHSPPFGNSFPLFFATGYLAFSFYNDIASLTGRSVSVNRPLLSYPAVTPLDTVLARLVLQVLTGLAVGGIVFAGILAIYADPVQIAPAPLMTMLALGAFLGLGVGLVNVTLFALSKGWEIAYGVISRPVLFVSCIFYSYESMPLFVREILWWNPIVHLVGLLRSGFYPVYDASHVSVFYVLALALGLTVLGLALMAAMGNRLVEP